MKRTTIFLLATTTLLLLFAVAAPAALIAHYSFDADNAADLSGNANTGTVGASVAFSTDTPLGSGKAMETTATGSAYVVTVPTSTSLESIDHQLTFSFWMKAGTAGQNNWFRVFQHANEGNGTQGWLINRYSSSTETNIRVDTTGAGGQFNQNLAEGVNTGTLDGQWHHMVYTLNNGTWEEYADGARASGSYSHGSGFSNTRPLYIAGRNNTAEYIGLLDDVAVWNERLSQGQSRSIYTVSQNLGLDYDIADMSDLWDIHAGGPGGSGLVDGTAWEYTTALPGSTTLGDAYTQGPTMYVVLGNGSGVASVPEPSTMLLAALGLLGLCCIRRRRK